MLIPPLALIFPVLGTIFLGGPHRPREQCDGRGGGMIMAYSRGKLDMAMLKHRPRGHRATVVLRAVHPSSA